MSPGEEMKPPDTVISPLRHSKLDTGEHIVKKQLTAVRDIKDKSYFYKFGIHSVLISSLSEESTLSFCPGLLSVATIDT